MREEDVSGCKVTMDESLVGQVEHPEGHLASEAEQHGAQLSRNTISVTKTTNDTYCNTSNMQ